MQKHIVGVDKMGSKTIQLKFFWGKKFLWGNFVDVGSYVFKDPG